MEINETATNFEEENITQEPENIQSSVELSDSSSLDLLNSESILEENNDNLEAPDLSLENEEATISHEIETKSSVKEIVEEDLAEIDKDFFEKANHLDNLQIVNKQENSSISDDTKKISSVDLLASKQQEELLSLITNVANIETEDLNANELNLAKPETEPVDDEFSDKEYSREDILGRDKINQRIKRLSNKRNISLETEVLQNSSKYLREYTKLPFAIKNLIRDLIKIALITNGIKIESLSKDFHISELKLSFRDGDLLNMRNENLILVPPTEPMTTEKILKAAEGADSITQILQRLQKSSKNKNARFKIEKVLASHRIILPS